MHQRDEDIPQWRISGLPCPLILRQVMAGLMMIAAVIASRMRESPGAMTPARFAFAALLITTNCWLGPFRLGLTARAFEADITLRAAARAIAVGFFASSLGPSVAGPARS